MRVVRATLKEIHDSATVGGGDDDDDKNKTLRYRGDVFSVVYFRAGYAPTVCAGCAGCWKSEFRVRVFFFLFRRYFLFFCFLSRRLPCFIAPLVLFCAWGTPMLMLTRNLFCLFVFFCVSQRDARA